jgi:NADPH:quinone reductase-like Zn-dependent oxidoreductase
VGTVRAVGPEVSESLIGTRVAAVTKVGGDFATLIGPLSLV